MSEPDAEPTEATVQIGGLRIQPGDRVGPYVYRKMVGKGGMAHVVVASDPGGKPVALKILKTNRVGSGLARFKREFRALARLRHPNVIRVEAYGDLFGHPYIAMEYVDGYDLHAAIHGFRTLEPDERWRRCEAVLVDLCRALAYIHRRGLVHRDLKPSNVLIDLDQRCKLTDFGIVKDLDPDHDTALSTTLVGTWAYASPEQITGQPIDHRSDLYSLGVILFAMLTGRRPFVARDLAGYLELHRSHVAPAPRDVDPSVPAYLDEICVRLLRKYPRERFRSAQEILYRLERIDGDPEAADVATWTPPLVGRLAEDELLRERVAALTRAEGGVVILEGEEGLGKTRLIDVTAEHAQLVGMPVLRAAAAQRDGPLGPVLRLAAALSADLGARASASLGAAVQAFAGEDSAANARQRLIDALLENIDRLRDDGPVVMLLDDAHLAQPPTLDLLRALATRATEPSERAPILLVLAQRGDRVGGRLAQLRAGDGLARPPTVVPVGALAPEAVQQLVVSLIGPGRSAQALAERLFRETDGHVLFLVLFLQNLMLQGMLARTGSGWRLVADIEEVASGHFDVPPGVRQVVRARLTPLTPTQRPLVDALAVHGREMDLDVLLDVLELDEEQAADSLEELEDLGIVRQRRSGASLSLDFAHSKFGDVLYRELDDERRADLHRRVAAALELRVAHVPAAAEVVGEHYRRAGESGKAYVYLTQAARRLVERGLPAEAAELADRADAVAENARVDLDPAEFTRVHHALLLVRAEAAHIRGAYAQAREALEEAVSLAFDGSSLPEVEAIRAFILLGRALRNLGDAAGAEERVNAALPRARALHERAAVAEGLLVLGGVAWDRGELDVCEAHAREGLLLATGTQLLGARARLLLALTAVQASRGQLAAAASGLAEAQLLFKELGMRPSRALALANLAEVQLGQGDLLGAWGNGEAALAEARGAGHRVGELASQAILGMAALQAGARDVARAAFEAAAGIARALGVPSEGVAAGCLLGRLSLEEGDADGALAYLDGAAEAASAGDPERYAPMIDALRAQALARVALASGWQGEAPSGSGEGMSAQLPAQAARVAIAAAEAALPSLPILRRAQVSLDVARARVLLGDPSAALQSARSAAHLSSLRGFRLLTLDALAVVAWITHDEAERTRLIDEVRDYVREVLPSVPPSWQGAFCARLGLGPDA